MQEVLQSKRAGHTTIWERDVESNSDIDEAHGGLPYPHGLAHGISDQFATRNGWNMGVLIERGHTREEISLYPIFHYIKV